MPFVDSQIACFRDAPRQKRCAANVPFTACRQKRRDKEVIRNNISKISMNHSNLAAHLHFIDAPPIISDVRLSYSDAHPSQFDAPLNYTDARRHIADAHRSRSD